MVRPLPLHKLQAALQADPNNDVARFDLIKLLLESGDAASARSVFEPVATRYGLDARLVAAGHWISAVESTGRARSADALQAAIAANRRDFDARFELAQTHFAAGRFTQAMDELLEIIMRDKGWSEELARKTYVAILEIITKPQPKPTAESGTSKGGLEITGKAAAPAGDPVVDQYRRKLSMALF